MTREEELEQMIRDLLLVGELLIEGEWGGGDEPTEEERTRFKALFGETLTHVGPIYFDVLAENARKLLKR